MDAERTTIKIDPIVELLIADVLVHAPPYPRGIKTYPDLRLWAEGEAREIRLILKKGASDGS